MKGNEVLALHESGHAIAAVKLGLSLFYVNVTDTDDSNGQAMLSSMEKADASQLAIYHLAGPLAERKATGRSEWPAGASRDLAIAELCCKIAARESKQSFDEEWDELLLLATLMVENNWDAIKRVASQLAWKGELVGSAVRKLMVEAK